MLYIGCSNTLHFEWYIDEPIPINIYLHDSKFFVVQADGKELEYVRSLFPAWTPPMLSLRQNIVTWHGDIAKTIVTNL